MKALRAAAWMSGCLSLCAAAAMAVSPWWSIHLRIRSSVIVSSVEGGLRLHVWTSPREKDNASPPWLGVRPPPRPYEFVRWWSSHHEPGAYWWVTVPMWMVVPVSATPMVVMIARGIARRRVGKCRGCGYDLRGLPAGNPCPECGGKVKPGLAVADGGAIIAPDPQGSGDK